MAWTSRLFESWDKDANDDFGNSVAMSADASVLVIGEWGDDVVRVFSGANWATQTTLTASDADGNEYGRAVDISSDGSIIVVASDGSASGGTTRGAVYVYTGTNWVTETKLTASDGVNGDVFGTDVAISADGTVIAVGATGVDDSANACGALYVLSGANWATETKLIPADAAANDQFGLMVAASSTGSVVIGTTIYKDSSKGAAYVFSGANWATETKLTASDAGASDNFGMGCALSSDGSVAVIGAPYDDDEGTNAGAVYVYSGTTWGTEKKLTVAPDTADEWLWLGMSVAIDGNNQIVAGATRYWWDEDFDEYYPGRICIFPYSGGTWSFSESLSSPDGEESQVWMAYTHGVAISNNGRYILAGCPCLTDGSRYGKAYLWSSGAGPRAWGYILG
jgi:hypothetical protein